MPFPVDVIRDFRARGRSSAAHYNFIFIEFKYDSVTGSLRSPLSATRYYYKFITSDFWRAVFKTHYFQHGYPIHFFLLAHQIRLFADHCARL